jgi:hypothetical protein
LLAQGVLPFFEGGGQTDQVTKILYPTD